MESDEKVSINSYKVKKLLTNRELEYLALVALGTPNQEIADILFVTLSTVKKTLENIFKKLDARDRANAVSIGYTHELLTTRIVTDFETKFGLKRKRNNL